MPFGAGAQADALRVFLNRMTMGLAGGDTTAAEQRLGRAAPIAAGAGTVAGLIAPFKLVKGAKIATQALPRLSEAAKAGIRATGAMRGATRGEALARLGIERQSMAAAAAARAARAVRAHPITTGAATLGLGALALGSRGDGAEQAASVPASVPARAVDPGDLGYDPIPEALRAPDGAAQPMTFESMLAGAAQANGGKLNYRQMVALADVMNKTMPRGRQGTRPQDAVVGRLASTYDQLYAREVQELGPEEAQKNWLDRYEGLAKMNAADQLIRNSIDPEGGY